MAPSNRRPWPHHHLLHLVAGQPVAQRQQTPDCGRKLRHALLTLAAVVRDTHARGDLRLVDVQRRRALDDHLHPAPFPSTSPNRRPGASRTIESDSRARSTVRSSGETPHAKLKTGSQAPRQRGGVTGDAGIIAPFMRPRASAKRTDALNAEADLTSSPRSLAHS